MFATRPSLISWIREIFGGENAARPIIRSKGTFKPWAEVLEERNAPADFNVTVLTDSTLVNNVLGAPPAGSLRLAVNQLQA